MSKCRGCGADIRWIKTKAGKLIPVNPEPTYLVGRNGTDIIVTEDGLIANGTICPVPVSPGHRVGWVSHFATCPMAAGFRRRK